MERTITALTVQKNNHQRVNVYLDGEFAFGLARVLAAWLPIGQKLTDEKIAQLKDEDIQEQAYQKALNLIKYRPRTEAEIRQRLSKSGLAEQAIDATIERLHQIGLIDDQQFAQNWVESRNLSHPRSRRALAYEMLQKGLDRQVIQQSLTHVNDNDVAYRTALKRSRKYLDLERKEFNQKMYTFLAQRGFDYETCRTVIGRVWNEIHRKNEKTKADLLEPSEMDGHSNNNE